MPVKSGEAHNLKKPVGKPVGKPEEISAETPEETPEETQKREDREHRVKFFFSSYLWLGVVLTLFAIVLDIQFPSESLLVKVPTNLLASIGIAIVVASIFTFASGTSEFVTKIRNLLQDIVVGRNFLGNIDAEGKREALNSLIKPSSEEKRIYSNIEDYLNTYINQTMDVTNKCVRSNYNVNARAYYNKQKKMVFVDSKISYRVYPTKDGYSDIKIAFGMDDKDSFCSKVTVCTPHGKRAVFEKGDMDSKPQEISSGKVMMATIDLKEYAKKCSHLDVTLDMTEGGNDHWIMLSFSALMPTDGFKHDIRCDDGLVINSHCTFIHGAQIYVDKTSDSEMTISCNEWVNEGTGLSVLVSKPHEPLAS